MHRSNISTVIVTNVSNTETTTHIERTIEGYHLDGLPFHLTVRAPNNDKFRQTLDVIVKTIKDNINGYVNAVLTRRSSDAGAADAARFLNSKLSNVMTMQDFNEVDLAFMAVFEANNKLQYAAMQLNRAAIVIKHIQPQPGCPVYDSRTFSVENATSNQNPHLYAHIGNIQEGDKINSFTILTDDIELFPAKQAGRYYLTPETITKNEHLFFGDGNLVVPHKAEQIVKQNEIYESLVATLKAHRLSDEASVIVNEILSQTSNLNKLEAIHCLEVVNSAINNPAKNTVPLLLLAHNMDTFPSTLHKAISTSLYTLAALCAAVSIALLPTVVGAPFSVPLAVLALGLLFSATMHNWYTEGFYTNTCSGLFGLPKQLNNLASELNKDATSTTLFLQRC